MEVYVYIYGTHFSGRGGAFVILADGSSLSEEGLYHKEALLRIVESRHFGGSQRTGKGMQGARIHQHLVLVPLKTYERFKVQDSLPLNDCR